MLGLISKAIALIGNSSSDAIASVMTINGKPVPVETVQTLVGAVALAMKMGATGAERDDIIAAIKPAFVSVAEEIAGLIVPGGGTAVALAVWALEHSRPMTWDEEQAWMQRTSDAALYG